MRAFWRGEWDCLWDGAHIKSKTGKPSSQDEQQDAKRLAQRMAVLASNNEWSKAMKAAVSTQAMVTDPAMLPEITAKLPQTANDSPAPRYSDPSAHTSFWENVATQVRKDHRKLPRKAGPGLDGNRIVP